MGEHGRGVGGGRAETRPQAPPVRGAPSLRRPWCRDPGVRRLGAAKGEGTGAATPGPGPRQQLCDKSPDLSVPGFVITVETGHATASVPRDPLVVCPQCVGFERVARAPGQWGR